jgi:hypothetical protein
VVFRIFQDIGGGMANKDKAKLVEGQKRLLTLTFEPIDQVVSKKDQMEIGLIGSPMLLFPNFY